MDPNERYRGALRLHYPLSLRFELRERAASGPQSQPSEPLQASPSASLLLPFPNLFSRLGQPLGVRRANVPVRRSGEMHYAAVGSDEIVFLRAHAAARRIVVAGQATLLIEPLNFTRWHRIPRAMAEFW